MVEIEVKVVPEQGIHARPAAKFVKTAKRFTSDIKVIKDGREANAKSALKLMTIGAKKGDDIIIRAEGEDAEEAVNALAEIAASPEE